MSEPRVSALLRTDYTGLGTLSRSFYENLGFHRTISLSFIGDRNNDKWITGDNRHLGRNQITKADAEWLLDGAESVLSFETWYSAEVPLAANKLGVKSALIPMAECTPQGGVAWPLTDLMLCPHGLCLNEMMATPAFHRADKMELPIPLDTVRLPFRQRERAETFVHFAKRTGHLDRDGTNAVVEAWSHVKSDARLLIYTEAESTAHELYPRSRDARVEVRQRRIENYFDGWCEGDVLLHPHRFAGYSCPVHEALTAGMPVMVTKWWPFTDFTGLPHAATPFEPDLLERYTSNAPGFLPPSSQGISIEPDSMQRRVICRPTISFDASPVDIAAAVDRLYGQDISAASRESRAWAESRSWEALRGKWIEVLV